jgi:hypothetical protein
LLRAALEAQRRIRGLEHRETIKTQDNLAMLYQAQGNLAEAEALFRATVETARRVFGPDHYITIGFQKNLAKLDLAQSQRAEASPMQRPQDLGAVMPNGAAAFGR